MFCWLVSCFISSLPSSMSKSSLTYSQRLHKFFDDSLVGVCNMSNGLRFCVEHGTNVVTGVSPVPPSMRLSKLNIPVDGVPTVTPAISVTFFPAIKSDGFKFGGTGRNEGRLGFCDFPVVVVNVGVKSWGMYGVVGVGVQRSNSWPESLKWINVEKNF